MSKKKGKGFNNPFAELKERFKEAQPEKPAKPVQTIAKPVQEETPEPDEQRLFEDEMSGVAPLAPDPRGRRGAPESVERAPIARRAAEEAEAYAQLADLVDGTGVFDIADSDEYIEGIAPGIDRRLLKRLRKGDYAIQAHVDLHGMSSEEARAEIERFVDKARAGGRRCVLIIHGRGLNSKQGIPVLKERMKVWLTRGRIGSVVLAFATARPADGGAGAVYVLLRK